MDASASQIHAIEFHHRQSESEGDVLSGILHAADAMANVQGLGKNFTPEQNSLAETGFSYQELKDRGSAAEREVDSLIESMEQSTG